MRSSVSRYFETVIQRVVYPAPGTGGGEPRFHAMSAARGVEGRRMPTNSELPMVVAVSRDATDAADGTRRDGALSNACCTPPANSNIATMPVALPAFSHHLHD